jgi:hypothetical protein
MVQEVRNLFADLNMFGLDSSRQGGPKIGFLKGQRKEHRTVTVLYFWELNEELDVGKAFFRFNFQYILCSNPRQKQLFEVVLQKSGILYLHSSPFRLQIQLNHNA